MVREPVAHRVSEVLKFHIPPIAFSSNLGSLRSAIPSFPTDPGTQPQYGGAVQVDLALTPD